MSCSIHPQWYHLAEDCPYCAERRGLEKNIMQGELLDLITLMPDSQTQEIVDYILALREIRKKHANSNPNERRTFNPDTDIPDCRPKR